ncbi:hypothetical protein [Pelomonas sp. Root1444]|uniref:hypothetical protein n=1 Tax=Pelomonas sp. Root1444 TaxID=1736464 RepID=UPI000702891E|nr:hypothetical protein [Pelomonas sp. Root1444]KQY83642.1 hypothetical protein ASD35_24265 [Pelomonas sp. Root1444]
MPPLWLIKLLGVLALLAGVWFHGDRTGAAGVRAEWDAQRLAEQQAAEAQAEQQRLRARAAATDYETKRAALLRRLTQPSPESVYALHATICPPAGALGKPLELGDVPVPGVWLDRLRNAGADF